MWAQFTAHMAPLILLLQSFILYCLPWKQTPQQSCLSKTQPGNSPTFSPFSEYTVVARCYLCIVSLKPSKPKWWLSCWKSSVPWLRDNCRHSSTRGKKKKSVPQYTNLWDPTGGQREQSEIQITWFWDGGTGPERDNKRLGMHSPQETVGRSNDCLEICPSLLQKKENNKFFSIASEDKARNQGVKSQQDPGSSLGKAF